MLNYLRYGKLITNGLSQEGILEEARFFEVESLIEIITLGKAKRELDPFNRLEDEIQTDQVSIVMQLDHDDPTNK